jgi:hypothetical protein
MENNEIATQLEIKIINLARKNIYTIIWKDRSNCLRTIFYSQKIS